MFFRFLMINTTDHGGNTPSLLSPAGTSTDRDRSDHVSILSNLAGGQGEARASSSGVRPRWLWWLAAAVLGGAAALVGMKQVSTVNRASDAATAPVVKRSPERPVAAIMRVENAAAAGTPTAAVIRDSSIAAAAVQTAPGVSRESAAVAANDVEAKAILAAPLAMTSKVAKPVASAVTKPARATSRSAKARRAPREVDSDVDIITAIVKHAEMAPAD